MFRDIKVRVLSVVEHKSFCLKFSGLISKLKILKKSYLSLQINIQCTDLYYFGLLLKLKNLWCTYEAFRIILLQRHKKFRCIIIFLSGMQLKIPAGKCDRYCVEWK